MNIFIKGALKSICQTPNLGPFRDSLYCLSPWVWVILSYFLLSLLKFYTEAGHFRQCIVTILYPVLLFFRLWFFFLLIWTETLELPPLWYLVDVSAKVCCCCFFFWSAFPKHSSCVYTALRSLTRQASCLWDSSPLWRTGVWAGECITSYSYISRFTFPQAHWSLFCTEQFSSHSGVCRGSPQPFCSSLISGISLLNFSQVCCLS